MRIITDKQMSWYDPVTKEMEYSCGSRAARELGIEDHLVTLDNGLQVHVFAQHGETPTLQHVVAAIQENEDRKIYI